MSKGKEPKGNNAKKAPEKSLMEKRAAKAAKRSDKNSESAIVIKTGK